MLKLRLTMSSHTDLMHERFLILLGIIIVISITRKVEMNISGITKQIKQYLFDQLMNCLNYVNEIQKNMTQICNISWRSEEHTSELQSRGQLVGRLLPENTNSQKKPI